MCRLDSKQIGCSRVCTRVETLIDPDFIVFPAGVYQVVPGSDEPNQQKDERTHQVTLARSFAMLDREISMVELIAFDKKYDGYMKVFVGKPADAGYTSDWYDSVAFCRWLTTQQGWDEDDRAYTGRVSLRDRSPKSPQATSRRIIPLQPCQLCVPQSIDFTQLVNETKTLCIK